MDLYLPIFDAYWEGANLDARVVRPGPICQPEAPRVPGASDDAVLDVAACKRSSHVWADVIDCVKLAVLAKALLEASKCASANEESAATAR